MNQPYSALMKRHLDVSEKLLVHADRQGSGTETDEFKLIGI